MANFTVKQQVQGVSLAIEVLGDLKRGARNRVLRPALAKGSQILAAEYKARLGTVRSRKKRGRTGQMRKAVGTVVKTYGNGNLAAVTGPRSKPSFKIAVGTRVRGRNVGQTIYHDPAKVGHLVEGGHGGPHAAGPHPDLEESATAKKSAIDQAVIGEIDRQLGKIAARAAAKGL